MSKELNPLFLIMRDGVVQQPVPLITDEEGEEYETVELLDVIVKEIEEESKDIVLHQNDKYGLLTFNAYLLLELLQRCGLENTAKLILSSKESFLEASMYCALGFLAGRSMPEDLDIETGFAIKPQANLPSE